MKTTFIFTLSFLLAFGLIVLAFFIEDQLTTKMIGIAALISAMLSISFVNGTLWKNKKASK